MNFLHQIRIENEKEIEEIIFSFCSDERLTTIITRILALQKFLSDFFRLEHKEREREKHVIKTTNDQSSSNTLDFHFVFARRSSSLRVWLRYKRFSSSKLNQ